MVNDSNYLEYLLEGTSLNEVYLEENVLRKAKEKIKNIISDYKKGRYERRIALAKKIASVLGITIAAGLIIKFAKAEITAAQFKKEVLKTQEKYSERFMQANKRQLFSFYKSDKGESVEDIVNSMITSYEEIEGEKVAIANDLLKMNAQVLAVASDDKIFVDDDFLKLDKKTQKFILSHERAHVDKDHASRYPSQIEYNLERIDAARKGGILDIEKEADFFAVDKIGKNDSVKALKTLNKHITKKYGYTMGRFPRKEVKNRIKTIKREK